MVTWPGHVLCFPCFGACCSWDFCCGRATLIPDVPLVFIPLPMLLAPADGACFLVFPVKPTFIDVDIYVNSIGPVSVIQMVSAGVPAGHGVPSPRCLQGTVSPPHGSVKVVLT